MTNYDTNEDTTTLNLTLEDAVELALEYVEGCDIDQELATAYSERYDGMYDH